MLRLQAQFPSTVSTVYRCVFVPGSGSGSRSGSGSGSVGTELSPWGSGQAGARLWLTGGASVPCPHTSRTSEKLVKAPRDGNAGGPPGPRCLLCMCALDIDTAGLCCIFSGFMGGRGTGEWVLGFTNPEVPSVHFCLQIVPRLLGPRPHISPRCSPPPHQLRHPPHPAALQGWAGPRAVAGGLSPAGGESLS